MEDIQAKSNSNKEVSEFVTSFLRRLSGEGYFLPLSTIYADEKTIELASEIAGVIKNSEVNYQDAKKALILADEGIYRQLTKKDNLLKNLE